MKLIKQKQKKTKMKKNSKCLLVYKTTDGRTELYTIDKPTHTNEFGNQDEGHNVVGFRTHCYNRGQWRAFRYDRVLSMLDA